MWSQDDLKLPDDWTIYQQITTINDSAFELYVQNMEPLLGAMLRGLELVTVNRCGRIPDDKLTAYRRAIRAMSRESEIVLEDKEGEVEQATLGEDLPYSLGADIIEVEPGDYGIRYINCMDQPERYKDRVVEFTATVLKSPKFPKGQFVSGRITTTYYEADMTFLGFMCKWPGTKDCKIEQWIKIRVKMGIEYQKDCYDEGPVLYAEHVERTEEIEDVVQF